MRIREDHKQVPASSERNTRIEAGSLSAKAVQSLGSLWLCGLAFPPSGAATALLNRCHSDRSSNFSSYRGGFLSSHVSALTGRSVAGFAICSPPLLGAIIP